MRVKISIWIWLYYTVTTSSSADPCTDTATQQLGSIRQRLVGYQLAAGEDAICDIYLKEGWYFTDTFVLASTNQRCGTLRNWYRRDNDSLPKNINEQRNIVLCRNGPSNVCDKLSSANVIKCAEDKYVFYLIPVSSCIEAYCLERNSNGSPPGGTTPDISELKLSISVNVARPKGENELQFYCDFTPRANTNFYYKVVWALSHGSSWVHQLHQSEPVKYLSQGDFRQNTMMTERHLKAPTYFGLGVTIACSITASIDPATPESAPVISPERFCGIRALNSSSHVAIHNDKGADIYYELTIPFGCEQGFESDSFCYLDVILFIPQSTTNCYKPDAIQSNSETNSCGLRFYRSDIGKPKKLFVKAKFPHRNAYLSQQMILTLTTVNNLAHPFFNGYAVDKVQIQIMTQPCFNNGRTPHCVCGVAVQAGSDVVVISTCARVLDIRFIQCGDGILREKVNEVSKTKYRVTLPSGSYVDISLVNFLMNVHVTPSVADFNKTSGLCGSFDGNINNDRLKRPGSTDDDPNRSWMVQAKDNLFNENVVLPHWEDQYRFCTCDSTSVKPINTATCDVETKKICDVKPVLKDRCVDKKLRKRRSGNGKYKPTDEGDFHQTVKLAFVSKYRDHLNQRQHRSIKQYTEETARQDCMQLLNTTAFQKCSNVPGLDFTATINDCILDAQITGTMEWTLSHLETIKSICIQQIDTQKLPPKEDLVGITVTINGTSFSNLSDENASLPLTVFTDEIFEEIQSVSCPHECSGFGICVNGSCICEKDHIGEDCSLDSTRPPEMIGIPEEGFCDLKERACKKTSVFGDNLIFENQVKCNIEPFEINVRNDILSEEKYQVTGVPQTFMEVSCPLEPSKKRSIDGGADINDIIARAYNISLSNDGLNFSEEDTFLVYDSACVTCSKTSGAIRCLKQSGLCMTDGECYGPGDTLGCYTCAVSGAGSAVWQPGPDCSKPSNDRPNSGGEQITAEYTLLLAFLAVAFGL